MNRPLIIGLIGLVLVIAGGISAWLQLTGEPPPATPVALSAPPSDPAAGRPTQQAAPPSAGATLSQPPAAPAARLAPSFDVVRINPAGDAVIAGRAMPNATVTIYDGDRELGKVKADARGEWVFVPSSPLPSGARELSLSAEVEGQAATRSDQVVVLAVPERGHDLAGRPAREPAVGGIHQHLQPEQQECAAVIVRDDRQRRQKCQDEAAGRVQMDEPDADHEAFARLRRIVRAAAPPPGNLSRRERRRSATPRCTGATPGRCG